MNIDSVLNTVICGDCLEVMKDIPNNYFDLVLTDPPYGIKMDKGFEGFGGFGEPIARRRYEDDDWDSDRPSKEYFDEILRVGKTVIIFGGNYFADILPVSTHWLVWDKLNTMPTFSDCELLWTNSKRKSVMKYTHEYNGLIGKEEYREHPTQKPLNLLRKIIENYSKPSDKVFDPFAGSGTTLRAAKDLSREYVGVEINQKYVDICNKRLRQGVLL